jgi:hypothetical protein
MGVAGARRGIHHHAACRPVDMEAFMVVQYMVIRVIVMSLSERLVDTHVVKS